MRALLTVVGLAAVTLLLWFWLVGESGAPSDTGAKPVAERREEPVDPAREPARQPARELEHPREEPAPQPERRVATAAGPDAGPDANVEVVEFETGEALAGAVVHYQPPDFDWATLEEAERQRLSELAGRDTELYSREVGKAVVTDARGRCLVPTGERGVSLAARAGELFGTSYVQKDEVLHRIALRRDATLSVVVLDGRDRPVAGVPVGMARIENGAATMSWAIGTTGENGRLDKPHAQLMAGEPGANSAVVYAEPPGGRGLETEVDLGHIPREDVVVRMPPTGSLAVQVLDSTGEPIDPRYLGRPEVSLTALDAKPSTRSEQSDAFNRHRWTAPIDAAGKAVFAQVALDRYLVVEVEHRASLGFDGPTSAVPHVEVTLRFDADGATIAGRAVDPAGDPRADRELKASYRYEGGSGSEFCRTDAEGRFRVYFGTYPVGRAIVFGLATSRLARTDEKLSAEVRIDAPIQKGITELGDVVVGASGVLVAGRVTEADGSPVEQIQLEVEREAGYWRTDWELRPEWSGDGRFEIRGGAPPDAHLRLQVRSAAHLPVEPIEFAIGTKDLRIELRSGGAVTAVFLVDDATPVQRLQYRLRAADAVGKPDMRETFLQRLVGMSMQPKDGRAEWTWKGLAPGSYRLTVACPGVDDPVAAIDGIAVSSGPASDARLDGIDLRGRVRMLKVRAIGASGEPIADQTAFVIVRSDQDGGDWYGFHLATGSAEIVASGPVDLVVFAPDHRLTEVQGVFEDRDIRLEPAPRMRLRLEAGRSLPDGTEISLELEPQLELPRASRITLSTGRGMMLPNFFRETVRFDATLEADLPVRFDSPYRVTAWLLKGGSDRRGAPLSGVEPREIRPGSAPVAVRVPAAAIDRALEGR